MRPLSSAATNLLAACRDPERSSRDIARLIEYEPALASRLLRIANSSAFGLPGGVRSIDHAVVALGFKAIQDLALAVSAAELFSGTAGAVERRQSIWLHSLACAVIARQIAQMRVQRLKSEAFLSGIFHDVGKLAFLDTIPDEYGTLLDDTNVVCLADTELEIFGVSHQQVGQQFATTWGLRPEIISVIGFHHMPDRTPHDAQLVQVASDANIIANSWQLGSRNEDLWRDMRGPLLCVDGKAVAMIRDEVIDEFNEAVELCAA